MVIWGLILIIAGWLVQLISIWFLKKEINRIFIILYCLGVVFLIIDGYRSGMVLPASLNAAALIIAFLILIKVRK